MILSIQLYLIYIFRSPLSHLYSLWCSKHHLCTQLNVCEVLFTAFFNDLNITWKDIKMSKLLHVWMKKSFTHMYLLCLNHVVFRRGMFLLIFCSESSLWRLQRCSSRLLKSYLVLRYALMDCWGLLSYRAGSGRRFSALLIWPHCVCQSLEAGTHFLGVNAKCAVLRVCEFALTGSLYHGLLWTMHIKPLRNMHTYTALPYTASLCSPSESTRYLPCCQCTVPYTYISTLGKHVFIIWSFNILLEICLFLLVCIFAFETLFKEFMVM